MIHSLEKKKNTTHWQYLWWFIQVKHYFSAMYSEPCCRRNKMAHSGSQCCVIRARHSPIYPVFPHVVLMGTHKKNYRITIMQSLSATFSLCGVWQRCLLAINVVKWNKWGCLLAVTKEHIIFLIIVHKMVLRGSSCTLAHMHMLR